MGLREAGYELVLRSAGPLLRVAAPFHAKLERGLRGRTHALARLQEWSATERDSRRPLVWLHAPSVGESLMAQAIAGALRSARPDLQLAFTHFSPSAERVRERVGADVADYLPWDTTAAMSALLAALRPHALAFVRTEIWPALVRLAAERGVPAALVNAVLAGHSSRLRPLARALLQPSYEALAAAGVIDDDVALRIQRLGVRAEHIRVTGDARFDQVWQRVAALDRSSELLRRLSSPDVITIVAGSTWPSDEAELLPALQQFANVRLVLAPHEPDERHLASAERALNSLELQHERLAEVLSAGRGLPRVVLVDRVGVLADLYALADITYVGGGFHSAGLHSVVEPAALGKAVVFGPQHQNAAEAAGLIRAGGGISAANRAELQATLARLIADTRLRAEQGAAARAFVEARLGGARRNAELILELLVQR